jgi:DNA-binding NarL/FixJ family response regulator
MTHSPVCGEASNASEAMEVIRKLHPDLAIVDLSLPGANGIESDQEHSRRVSEAAHSGALDARLNRSMRYARCEPEPTAT